MADKGLDLVKDYRVVGVAGGVVGIVTALIKRVAIVRGRNTEFVDLADFSIGAADAELVDYNR